MATVINLHSKLYLFHNCWRQGRVHWWWTFRPKNRTSRIESAAIARPSHTASGLHQHAERSAEYWKTLAFSLRCWLLGYQHCRRTDLYPQIICKSRTLGGCIQRPIGWTARKSSRCKESAKQFQRIAIEVDYSVHARVKKHAARKQCRAPIVFVPVLTFNARSTAYRRVTSASPTQATFAKVTKTTMPCSFLCIPYRFGYVLRLATFSGLIDYPR